jgi:hypothetical protein
MLYSNRNAGGALGVCLLIVLFQDKDQCRGFSPVARTISFVRYPRGSRFVHCRSYPWDTGTFTRSSATLLTAIPEDDGNTSPEDNELISTEIEPRFGDQRASPLADETTTFQEKLDAILDTQFFNPDDYNEDSQGPVAWFAKLVKNDYELAEALFVGLLFVILVILSQELLRMQLFGSNYAPFQTGAGMGRLF